MNQIINNMGKTKTIFKGVINGVEFNNVAEYNKRLTELLAAGKNINASTSTSTVDTCECCGKEVNECTCEKSLTSMLPGFESKEAVKNYIDKFVTDNDELDKSNMESYKKYLNENFTGINEVIRHMDVAALDNYRNDLNEVLDIIDEDLQNTFEAIRRKERELKTLDKAKSVLHMWNEYYMKNLDLVKHEIRKYDEKCVDCSKQENKENINNDNKLNGGWDFIGDKPIISSGCKYSGEEEPAPSRIATEEECMKAAQEARAKELENTLLGAVNSLLEAFGVKR